MKILQTYRPVFEVLAISILAFAAHKTIFLLTNYDATEPEFQYSLPVLYVIFSFLSMLIMGILVYVSKKNFEVVGQTFLLLTSVKLAIAYFFGRDIIYTSGALAKMEKTNFFIVFAVFLTIETICTIRLLNKAH